MRHALPLLALLLGTTSLGAGVTITPAPTPSMGVGLFNPTNTQSPCWSRWNGDGHLRPYQTALMLDRYCRDRMWAHVQEVSKHG